MCAAVDINTCGLVLGWDKVNRRKEHDQVKSCEVFTMSKTLLKCADLLFTESEVEIIPHGSNYLLAVTHAGVPVLCISGSADHVCTEGHVQQNHQDTCSVLWVPYTKDCDSSVNKMNFCYHNHENS